MHNQTRLQQYVSWELPDVQAEIRKGRETRDQIANIRRIIEKARELQKTIYFCFIDCAKAFVWMTTKCWKFLKSWEYQTILLTSWETCMQVEKQQLELDMEQQTGSSAFSKSSWNIWKFTDNVLLSLAWKILSITLLACEMSAIVQ